MGQGYSLTTLSAGSAGIDVPELADLTYETSLGEARFMKAIRARHSDGLVVAKIVMKPYASMKFGKYIKDIMRERKILADVPNALGYHRAFETSSNGYLVRQFMLSSLYERFSTRPFLEDIEKRWIAFQLLCAVRDCHGRNVYHGDIKSENILLTSWNWMYLTDFSSSFKPTYLPEDNPADFSFFFDISGRRTCYLAPERFLSPGEVADGKGGITWAMDIFSAGCVIAELFLEGPIFNLSQLFRYRNGEYSPQEAVLTRIDDPDIREMVSHMINLEPESRYSADEYLNFWRHKMFPEYFYGFLHQYMHLVTDPSSGRAAITSGRENMGESDERVDRIYHDFDKIAYFLDYDDAPTQAEDVNVKPPLSLAMFPLHLDIPNKRHIAVSKPVASMNDGTLLFLNLVLSSCRSTARSTGRIRACDLILVFSARLSDEARLDRVLPFLVDLLDDEVNAVRVAALRSISQLLTMVSTASPANAGMFADYLFQHVRNLSSPSQDAMVRVTFASCLAPLAESASRILDVIYALKAEGRSSSNRMSKLKGASAHNDEVTFDAAKAQLIQFFETQSKVLLTDPDPDVRRAFLGSVSSLCVFFGSAKASDVLLSHLNTYLNDKDWRLKCAFFQTIVGVATYVGGTNLEEFILPLMIQSLTDPEETVVEEVLKALASMAQLGLFQRSRTWELIDLVARFTMHPNTWIREAATDFVSSSTKFISPADLHCIVKPFLNPYLRRSAQAFDELSLLDCFKKPLSRIVFEMAITWAQRVDKGIFWKPFAVRIRAGRSEEQIAIPSSTELDADILKKVPKYDEDKQWLKRLEAAGLSPEDQPKLVALKEYIWRTAKRRDAENTEWRDKFNKIISLKDLSIAPETIFFDLKPLAASSSSRHDETEKSPQTIQDALLDASTTIDNPRNRRLPSVDSSESNRRSSRPQVPAPIASSPLAFSPMQSNDHVHGQFDQADTHQRERGSGSELSPADSSPSALSDTASLKQRTTLARPKSSALDLIQGRAAGKAFASTETSSSNAVGTLDKSNTRESSPAPQVIQEVDGAEGGKPPYRGSHTYSGRDPAVLKLLDTLHLDGYSADSSEFGPTIVPVERRQWEKKSFVASEGRWRPKGTLVALLGEHTGSVNKVAVSPDHNFFVTGSDDGSVKVWDAARLERNLSHRSRQTHKHSAGAKITALCFISQTHCFVSAATDGSIHIVRVDCTESSTGTTKYGRLKVLRRYQLPEPLSHATWIEHQRIESSSILHIATTNSKVFALDIRTMSITYTLHNPIHHGTPLSFCTDHKHHWLLLGTSHGVLDLWDLRFRLRVRSFAFPGSSPIHSVRLHPIRGSRRRQVLVAGGTSAGDVTVWDIEKLTCKEVYRTQQAAVYHQQHPATLPPSNIGPTKSTVSKDTPSPRVPNPATAAANALKPYLPWHPDATPRPQTLNRFASSTISADHGDIAAHTDGGVRALCVGFRIPVSENSGSSANIVTGSSEPRHGFFVAAGPDQKVRFWDMDRVEASCVVSGLEAEEAQPGYGTIVAGVDCIVSEERAANAPRHVAAGIEGIGKDGSGKRRSERGRSTVISLQQQTLLKSHLDTVMDVAVLEYPYSMVISADRAGMVYVFS